MQPSTAKDRFEALNSTRSGVLDRARQAADLTIPALMPPEGSDQNTVLPTPYQSLGARGVNNLASKLLLALFPPSTPFFRLTLEDAVAAELGASRTQVEEGLRQLEQRALKRVEASNLRVMLHACLKHLVVCGDALLYLPTKGGARMYRLSQYCVVRDPMGTWTEIVIKESVHASTLDPETIAACAVQMPEADAVDPDNVDIFTKVEKVGNKVEYWQEINEKEVPGTRGRNKAEECPYIPLRWSAVENEDYGRSLVEEYQGDLRSLEGLSKGVVAFSAVASKIIFLNRPNSSTDTDAIADAESGDIVTGNIEDVNVLQLDKYADFQVSKAVIDDLTLRLSHAFLLQSGTVRDAERVTAEEIRWQAQELEDVLGGVYTVQSQELQLPVVRRLIAQMKADGDFPKLPKVKGRSAVSPQIITGFEALGRGHELNRLRAFISDGAAMFGEAFMSMFNPQRAALALATQHNVEVADLLKTPEEIQQEQQQAMAQQMMDKAAGPVAGAMAKSAAEGEPQQ